MIWCKRCWKFLECAKIKVKQGQKAQIHKKSEVKQNQETTLSDGKVGSQKSGKGKDDVSDKNKASQEIVDKNLLQNEEHKSAKILQNVDEFKDFYLFPHEYLCLACNSFERLDIMKTIPKPEFQLKKDFLHQKNHGGG
jgi:hypothetical protein